MFLWFWTTLTASAQDQVPASPLGRALGQYYRTCFKRFRSSWSSSAVGNGLNSIFFFSDQWEEDCVVDSAKAAALALVLATATRCSPQPLSHTSPTPLRLQTASCHPGSTSPPLVSPRCFLIILIY